IEKELLKDYSKAQMLRITSFISNDEAYFEKLMYLVFKSQDAKVRQRAAWCMSNVFDIYPYLIYPYIATLINMLDEADLHDALKRNTLRVLQSINIPEHLQGKALELCYNFFKS